MSVSHVYLMSSSSTVRIPLEDLAKGYAHKERGSSSKEDINWAKGKLLCFNCAPCEDCDRTGRKSVKYLGFLELKIKQTKNSAVTENVIPAAEYFLQSPGAVKSIRASLEAVRA